VTKHREGRIRRECGVVWSGGGDGIGDVGSGGDSVIGWLKNEIEKWK